MTCLISQFSTFSRPRESVISSTSLKSFLSLCRITAKLEETAPDQVEVFKTNCNVVMKDILARFKDLQFFTGESMDCDGIIALLEYREEGPVLMAFKHGLLEEKF